MAQQQNKKKQSSGKSTTSNRSEAAPKKKQGGSVKNTAEADNQQPVWNRQKIGVILMAIAVLMIFITFIEGQSAWLALHKGMFGLFGFCAFLWPLMLIYIAVICAMDKPLSSVRSNLIGISCILLLIEAVIHIFSSTSEDLGIWMQITEAWKTDKAISGGGALGALFGGTFIRLFGDTGAGIVTIILLAVSVLLTTGTGLSSVYKAITKPVKKVADTTSAQVEKKKEKHEQELIIKKEPIPKEPKQDIDLSVETEFKSRKKKIVDIGIGSVVNPVPELNHTLPEDNFPYDFIKTDDLPVIIPGAVSEENVPDVPDMGEEPSIDDLRAILNKKKGIVTEPPAATVEQVKVNEPIIPEEPVKPKRTPKPKKEPEPDPVEEPKDEGAPAYRKPPIDCLLLPKQSNDFLDGSEIESNSKKLINTLDSFGVKARILDVYRGPTVTRYELQPAEGVKISKITSLADDIALRLAASGVRIEAPIPNKAAIGIEVPNKAKSMVALRELIDTSMFKTASSKLNVALGKDITGNIICADLAKMPHLLIAGTTGSGKSVCLNAMIISLLYNATPEEVKLLMIDPKQVEFMVYNGIPHLEIPVVSDAKKAAGALGWAVSEMLVRYKLFSEKNVRDITGYNKLADSTDGMKRMCHFVIFIDELSDLMMAAPDEVEDSICRLAQMARAAGMHLVIATQRPSVNVITGVIKANIPSRISLSVSSQIDSRTIIDMAGAEKLLGNGDMLFNPVGISKPVRVQGCFVSEQEVEQVVGFIKNQSEGVEYNAEVMEEIEKNAQTVGNKKKASVTVPTIDADGDSDEMLPRAIEVVVEAQMASTTLLQRKLKLGYARAARLVDDLEERKIVGPFEGSKPRKVLISKQQWMEMYALSSDDDLPIVNDSVNDEDDE